MNRTEVIQKIIDKKKARTYLEIGVDNGDNFFRIKARRKIAIDPNFSSGLDVAFIDGLHTYKQSLLDINNTLNYLNENGVIIMHDCNPPHQAAAHPAESIDHAAALELPGWTGEWCGDVWKTICYLRNYREDLSVCVLDTDYGLGIVTKRKADRRLGLTEDELEVMTYEALASDKKNLLNLKDEGYLFEFLKTI